MGARRPKPTTLKERDEVQPKLGLSRLFAVANLLVPQGPPTPPAQDDKTLKLEDPRLKDQSSVRSDERTNVSGPGAPGKTLRAVSDQPRFAEESDYGTAVVVPNRKKPTPISEGTKTQPISPRTSVTALKKKSSRRFEIPSKYYALFFLVPAIGLFSYLYFTGSFGSLMSTHSQTRQSALTPEQIKERLEFHRETTGTHLNRERIDVQIENFRHAPSIGADAVHVKPPSMMDGLPLRTETNPYTRNPKGDLPYDPTYSEAKTAYGLQEEQDRIEFEKRARKEWVREFIENARQGGYDVTIDRFGNVKSKPIPPEQRGPVSETGSSVFETDQ